MIKIHRQRTKVDRKTLYIEALFRNSKQKTQNVKNTTMMNLKLPTY